MNKPIFTQADLEHISRTKAASTNDVVPVHAAASILRVTRDRSDLGLPAGQLIAVRDMRNASDVPDGSVVFVFLGHGEHVLARAPITEGTVVGVVLGVLGEVPDAG